MSDFHQGGGGRNKKFGGGKGGFGGGGFKKFGGDRGGRGGFGGKREGGFGGGRDRGERSGFGGGERREFGGGRDGGEKSFGDGFQKREVTMHAATCGECGNACEVPFKPSNDKPVFCNDCFISKRNERDAGHRGDNNRGERREERGTKERYISTPRELREVKSFDNSGNEKAISELRSMVVEMGRKIESLTTLVESSSTKKESKPAKVVKEKVVKVAAKKTAVKKIAKKK